MVRARQLVDPAGRGRRAVQQDVVEPRFGRVRAFTVKGPSTRSYPAASARRADLRGQQVQVTGQHPGLRPLASAPSVTRELAARHGRIERQVGGRHRVAPAARPTDATPPPAAPPPPAARRRRTRAPRRGRRARCLGRPAASASPGPTQLAVERLAEHPRLVGEPGPHAARGRAPGTRTRRPPRPAGGHGPVQRGRSDRVRNAVLQVPRHDAHQRSLPLGGRLHRCTSASPSPAPAAATSPPTSSPTDPTCPARTRSPARERRRQRVLDLGCGAGHNAIALARQGAKVIGVDASSDQVAEARAACEREEVRVGAPPRPPRRARLHPGRHHRCGAVGVGPRRGRRHRPGVPAGRPGPAPRAPAGARPPPPGLRHDRRRRPRATGAPLVLGDRRRRRGPAPHDRHPFTALGRANFRVDTVLEPQPPGGGPRSAAWHDHMRYVPSTLIIRARSRASDPDRLAGAGPGCSPDLGAPSRRGRAGPRRGGHRRRVGSWIADAAATPTSPPPRPPRCSPGATRSSAARWAGRAPDRLPVETPTIWWRYRLDEERTHTRMVTSTDANGNSHTRTETYEQWHEIDDRSDALGVFEVVDTTGRCPFGWPTPMSTAGSCSTRSSDRRTVTRAGSTGSSTTAPGATAEREDGSPSATPCSWWATPSWTRRPRRPSSAANVLVSTRSEASRTGWLGAGRRRPRRPGPRRHRGRRRPPGGAGPRRGRARSPSACSSPCSAWSWPGRIITHNRLRQLGQSLDRAWSLIGVQLQRRHDLIPVLVDAVAAHAAHERQVLGRSPSGRLRGETDDAAALSREAVAQTERCARCWAAPRPTPS